MRISDWSSDVCSSDLEKLLFAQLIGSLAFEAARRVSLEKGGLLRPDVKLTERQRECLILAARGQTDAEIARTLGISEETATLHLKTARERYGVSKRLPLAIRALYDGQISFWEAQGCGISTPFWALYGPANTDFTLPA